LNAIARASDSTPGQVLTRLVMAEGERIGIGCTLESLQAWQDSRLALIDARAEARRLRRSNG
jgi:hypothetical protein